jgi:hypothetical protein
MYHRDGHISQSVSKPKGQETFFGRDRSNLDIAMGIARGQVKVSSHAARHSSIWRCLWRLSVREHRNRRKAPGGAQGTGEHLAMS